MGIFSRSRKAEPVRSPQTENVKYPGGYRPTTGVPQSYPQRVNPTGPPQKFVQRPGPAPPARPSGTPQPAGRARTPGPPQPQYHERVASPAPRGGPVTQPGGSGGLRNWMGGGRKDKRKQPTSTRHAGPPPAGVDRRGYGIKVLATCAEPVVDICFVHGLSGTRVGTWRAKGCEHPWPQDLLPRSLGNVRVLTYGYDASTRPKDKSAGRGSSNRLLENAQNLALDLQNMRDEDPGAAGRPIIFVAHSLGGLVCKEALVYARDNVYSGTRGVYDCTHGVIFLGTPHRGASAAKDMAPFARALSAHTSASLEANLDLLKPGNQHLDGLLRDFSNLVLNRASRGKPIHVVCFFEEHETRIGAFKPRHIVPRESAVVDGWAHYGIPADHAHMVKFASHEDPGYKRVCFFLNRWTRDIATRLESQAPGPSAGREAALAHNSHVRACLDSLMFPSLNTHYQSIPAAMEGTCKWLPEHKTFTTWAASSRRQILWIKGKAGTGKSTLVKHLISTHPPLRKKDAVVLSFFFNGRGTSENQKTPLGLFRALLHQVLSRFPDTLLDLVELHRERAAKSGGQGVRWDLSDLHPFFARALVKVLRKSPVWLFIDGLDECRPEDAANLAGHLATLCATLPSDTHPFRLCCSCRPFRGHEKHTGFEICPERENGRDLRVFIETMLYTHRVDNSKARMQDMLPKRALGSFSMASSMVEQVVNASRSRKPAPGELGTVVVQPKLDTMYANMLRGMGRGSLRLFQWLSVTSHQVRLDQLRWAMVLDPSGRARSLNDYKSAPGYIEDDDQLQARLERLGGGFIKIKEVIHNGVGRLFMWPTNPREVRFADDSIKDFFLTKGLAILERLVKTSSRDGDDSSDSGVDLDGRNNADGNINAVNLALKPGEAETAVGKAHKVLSLGYLHYFGLTGLDSTSKQIDDRELPLVQYAVSFWALHLREADARGIPQDDMLAFCSGPLSQVLNRISRLRYRWDCQSERQVWMNHMNKDTTSLLHAAAEHGMMGLLRLLLDRVPLDLEAKDMRQLRPLHFACRGGHLGAVKLLCAAQRYQGLDGPHNQRQSYTPLYYAVKHEHVDIVKFLLSNGDVNVFQAAALGEAPLHCSIPAKDKSLCMLLLDACDRDLRRDWAEHKLLHQAVTHDRLDVIQRLLDAFVVDVNCTNSDGVTPLHWAVLQGRVAATRLLLTCKHLNVNAEDIMNAETPVQIAIRKGNLDIIRLILARRDADLYVKEIEGNTALTLAAHHKDWRVTELVRSVVGSGPDEWIAAAAKTPPHAPICPDDVFA